jgi:hypothetical protein
LESRIAFQGLEFLQSCPSLQLAGLPDGRQARLYFVFLDNFSCGQIREIFLRHMKPAGPVSSTLEIKIELAAQADQSPLGQSKYNFKSATTVTVLAGYRRRGFEISLPTAVGIHQEHEN